MTEMTAGITLSSTSPPPPSPPPSPSPTEPESEPAPQKQQKYPPLHRATLELLYFKAVSLYRRRNYEKCSEVCNAMLQTGHENNVQMFARDPDDDDEENEEERDAAGSSDSNHSQMHRNNSCSGSSAAHSSRRYSSNLQRGMLLLPPPPRRQQARHRARSNKKRAPMPTWMMEGVWQLKMRALTQRVFVDDLETNDDAGTAESEEVEFERIATAARPGTSIRTAFIPRPSTVNVSRQGSAAAAAAARMRSAMGSGEQGVPQSGRPISAMARPGTALSRPGSTASSLGQRPASRCGTASRVRAVSAAAYAVGDATAPLYQASRLNPTIYAERQVLVKSLFQFLFYHESDVHKAYSLCEAVTKVAQQQQAKKTATARQGSRPATSAVDWWWDQQMGRCLLALRYPRKAELHLQQSLVAFPHPDTYLLLSRLYQRLGQPQRALDLINSAVERHPFDVTFRNEQGRIFVAMSRSDAAVQMYRLVIRLNPINIEALACIAMDYFYDNNPEMAVMYYRRILSLGVHTAELYCNIGLCCLYGGQIDLVIPCFERSLAMAKTNDQRADIWYNLSFVALTSGDFNLARRCLQLCLASDANNGAALNNIAVLSAHDGNLAKAKSYLHAANEVLSTSHEIQHNLTYMEKHYKL